MSNVFDEGCIAKAFLQRKGILLKSLDCPYHLLPCIQSTIGTLTCPFYYSDANYCEFECNVKRGSYLEKYHMEFVGVPDRGYSPNTTKYLVPSKVRVDDMYREYFSDVFWGGTIKNHFKRFREMIANRFLPLVIGGNKIGGPDSKVFLNFAKYQPGELQFRYRLLDEGNFILAYVDIDSNDVRVAIIDQISNYEIQAVSKRVLLPGTKYRKCGCDHSGDSTWCPAKWWVPNAAAEDENDGAFFDEDEFPFRMIEHLWRRYCKKHNINTFEWLLDTIKFYFPPK